MHSRASANSFPFWYAWVFGLGIAAANLLFALVVPPAFALFLAWVAGFCGMAALQYCARLAEAQRFGWRVLVRPYVAFAVVAHFPLIGGLALTTLTHSGAVGTMLIMAAAAFLGLLLGLLVRLGTVDGVYGGWYMRTDRSPLVSLPEHFVEMQRRHWQANSAAFMRKSPDWGSPYGDQENDITYL